MQLQLFSPTNADKIVYYVMILVMSSFRVTSNQGWYSQGREGRKKDFLKLARESPGMSGNLKKSQEGLSEKVRQR